jgi:hypothetical protein
VTAGSEGSVERLRGLSAAELTRLTRILAMLASPHDGERASAAYLASAFVAKHGLVWGDLTILLRPAPIPSPVVRQDERRHADPSWRGYCRRHRPHLGARLDCES